MIKGLAVPVFRSGRQTAGVRLLGAAVDTVLDRTVVLGYSRPGIVVRKRLPGWPDGPLDLQGKRVVVTGATGGLGYATARELTARGARVTVVGRSPDKVERTATELGGDAAVCDVSELASLKAFTDGWTEPIHALVNNAGVMPPTQELTDDGVELAWATNVRGPHVLIRDLAPHLVGGRVVNVSSGGMYGAKLGNPKPSYEPVANYAQTKRAEVVLTELWAERLAGKTVVHAMHPGWALTPGVESSLPTFRKVLGPLIRTPEEGADTVVWLCGSEEAGTTTGLFWHDRRARPTHLLGLNRETHEARDALWRELE